MSRVQLALRVADLESSVVFYSRLFGVEPAKRREGYANFALTEPALKLVLIEGEPGQDTRLDHLGVEVDSTGEVDAAASRLKAAGLAAFEQQDTSCCFALQDKVWVHGPGREPWEFYVVKADTDTFGETGTPAESAKSTSPVSCCSSPSQGECCNSPAQDEAVNAR